jgi:hypothetical protein
MALNPNVAGAMESGCFESACDLDEQLAACKALPIRHALVLYRYL